jgi:hypothetical protein
LPSSNPFSTTADVSYSAVDVRIDPNRYNSDQAQDVSGEAMGGVTSILASNVYGLFIACVSVVCLIVLGFAAILTMRLRSEIKIASHDFLPLNPPQTTNAATAAEDNLMRFMDREMHKTV